MKKISGSLYFLCWIASLAAQPASFTSRGHGGGGALFFPTINPADDNEFYVSCDMSELFHSTDFGRNYSMVPFTELQVFSTSTREFTADPLIAYSVHNDGNEGYPVRTADGGGMWARLPGYDANLGHVYRIVANYDKPQQVIMGYYGDIVISNNGGSSFSLVKHAAYMGAGITLGGVVFDGNAIYIGTNEGILFSNDSGNSFVMMTTSGIQAGQGIWSFAGAREGDTLRFFCITASTADIYNGLMPWDYYNFAKGVYAMDNASGAWVPRMNGISFASDFIMYAGMARNDVSTIYLAGNDHARYAPLVYKSSDGGKNWSKVFNTDVNQNITTGWCGYGGDKQWSWAETCFGIAVAPMNSAKAVFGDFATIYTTSDGAGSWHQGYVDLNDEHPAGQPTPTRKSYHSIGLESGTCWQVFWNSQANMFACYSDYGLIRSADSGITWGFDYSGMSVNSVYRIAGTPDRTIFAASSAVHDMYESTRLRDAQLDAADGSGDIWYSVDGGLNWNLLHAFGHPVFWIAIDPNDPKRMYASVVHYGGGASGQGGIWTTGDLENLASSSWTRLPPPPRTEGHPASIEVLNDGKVLCSFSGRINPAGSFTASSGVFIYDPASSSWTDISDPGMYYWTRDVIVDPTDTAQNTFYAAVFSGWGGAPNGRGGLYRTVNRGASWTKLTGDLFDRVTSLAFNPRNLSQAFLTTETQGLWISDDMTAATPSWRLVAGYPFRQPERVFFNPYDPDEVWVTSFGNGMRTGSMNSTTVKESPPVADNLSVFPNPFREQLRIKTAGNNENYEVFDALGIRRAAGTLADGSVRMAAGGWPQGIYFVRVGGSTARVIKF